MISILIPVYNQCVVSLVEDLKSQCEQLDIQFQILVYDDCSKPEYKEQNKSLHHEFGVNYIELSENLGRAKIRNRLARTAMFPHLLFLDCDSKIIKEDFIELYITQIGKASIVYGGRKYQKDKPAKEYVLHWTYGRKREALPLQKRLVNRQLNFQSNNFFISQGLFAKVKFDEAIEGYGYEDILFSEKVKDQGVPVVHIDNPVLHDGLETNEAFLSKNKNAVKNLVTLNKDGLLQNVRLTQFYNKAKNSGYLNLLLKYYNMRKDAIVNNLKSSSPSLRNFSLYKLFHYNNFLQHEKES